MWIVALVQYLMMSLITFMASFPLQTWESEAALVSTESITKLYEDSVFLFIRRLQDPTQICQQVPTAPDEYYKRVATVLTKIAGRQDRGIQHRYTLTDTQEYVQPKRKNRH